MAAAAWVRPSAPAVLSLGADGAAQLVRSSADRVAAAAARLDPDDDARLLAAAVEGSARAAAPHLLALPSIARPSALRLHAAVADAEHLTGQYAALTATGVLDETPVGSDLSHRQILTAALLHLASSVAGMVEQLARIQASEARVAAARAMDRDLEWTPPQPEPATPPAPIAVPRQSDGTAVAVGLAAVLAVLLVLLLSRCTGDATPHSLAAPHAAPHAASTTWSIR